MPEHARDERRLEHRRPEHHRIVVIGGGNAGLSVAGRLRRIGVDDIVVVEPRTTHEYKPLFSHVAGGTAPASLTTRAQESVMPRGVGLIGDAVTTTNPDEDSVVLASGAVLTYDHLIVCPGIQNDWDAVPGLPEAMAAPSGASNYELDLAAKASALLRDMTSGTVIFSQPAGPASCSGAIQKPMYLACDYWRAKGVLDDITVILLVPGKTVFGIDEIDRELERKIAEYRIDVRVSSALQEVDAVNSSVLVGTAGRPLPQKLTYDVLIAEPPQSAPSWLKGGPLTSPTEDGGFVDVDPQTLRHPRYPNVWSLGDAAATTNSKSGGAIRKQALVLAKNLSAVLSGAKPAEVYEGYSVCPFTVSRSTVVLAEFDDHGALEPTIPFWKRLYAERRLSWVFDRRILPWVYWHMILKGRA